MKSTRSAHGASPHPEHGVWIPTSRKKVRKGARKQSLAQGLCDSETFHPASDSETLRLQVDPIHLVSGIPPKYAVSAIVGTLNAHTSREMRQRFPWMKQRYWRNALWSVGFFSSTVGVNEDVIKRYVAVQEKVAPGNLPLDFGF